MAINFNKFTIKAQEAMQAAAEIATSYGNQQIEPEHLLAAIIQDNESVAVSLIQKIGIDPNFLRIKVSGLIDKLPKVSTGASANQYMSQNLAGVLEDGFKTASQLKDEYVSIEHILMALADSNSDARKLLKEQGITKEDGENKN